MLHRSVHRRLLAFLAVFALIDGATLLMCPRFGDDCLYGFFTLIAYPVILSGPLGMLLPHFAMRYGKDWRARSLISVTGAVLLLAVVTISHAAAIRLFNFHDYGGVLVRPRLLIIEVALSMIYYAVLNFIAYAKASARTG